MQPSRSLFSQTCNMSSDTGLNKRRSCLSHSRYETQSVSVFVAAKWEMACVCEHQWEKCTTLWRVCARYMFLDVSGCVKPFVPDDGRDAFCCSDSGAFPFWEPPSSHLFFSSPASMRPHCLWVKGFSHSIPPESCCQTCFIIVSPALLQADGSQVQEKTSGETLNEFPD